MNMSHCRFENTLSDLDDCRGALSDMREEPGKELSERELRCAKRLLALCKEITQDVMDAMNKDAIDDLEDPDFFAYIDELQDQAEELTEAQREEEEEAQRQEEAQP